MEDDYATLYDVVDRWCNRAKALGVDVSTMDDSKHIHKKADDDHAEISLFSADMTRVYVILDYDKANVYLKTKMLFVFSDGVRMTKKIKWLSIINHADVDIYEKRVISPAFDEMLNCGE